MLQQIYIDEAKISNFNIDQYYAFSYNESILFLDQSNAADHVLHAIIIR